MDSQAILDLRWVVATPSLIEDPSAVPALPLDTTSVDPHELDAFLAERASHRVGRYFENLVLFWLERIRKVTIVAHGHQIRDGNRTIGEIDFVFRDEHDRLTHWETAVKFFLHCPREAKSHFPGPNAKDNFERKVAKLFDKQLPLSREHFPDVQIRQAFVRGMMFYHPETCEPDESPHRLNPQHQRGEWIRSSELTLLDRFEDAQFAVLPKPTWLSMPTHLDRTSLTETREELERHFAESEFPVMLSVSDSSTEKCRMFVVPESWPTGR